ncbi:MAG: phage tail tape measure protein, partial [Turicibacter sp.]|nr:phage tail tape measure protein [Turicibacter sp.]
MSNDNFTMSIIAVLNKQLSKQRIKSDLKTMDNSMYVKVISKLSIALSQRQLKKDLKQLNDLYLQVGADLKIDNALKKKLQNRIKTLQGSISDLQIEVSAKDSNIAKTVTEARNKGQRVANRTSIDFNIEVKREKAIADLEYIAKKYSKLFSNASATQKYNNILDAAYGITDDKQLSNVRASIAAFTSELKANNLASQSLGDKWKSLIDRAKNLFSVASVVTLVFSQVKQAVSSFLQLDTAMTNLYKVQDQIISRDQFSGLLTKWNKLAQNLAVTTNSLISSMEAWSKIGFDLDMSEQLAEITSIFEKTAEISNEKATSTLISAAQAFTEIDDLGVDDYVKRVEAVGDKINAVGNKYAIDSEGIADGLQNASAALKVAGNDLNETIALITATNKIYQNPEEGSNMLKVASMRLRGQVDALKEMGEDAEGVSTDLTKIQQQVFELTGNKVKIFEDDENLKSTYQMILEIGEVFDSLSDRSQADLLEVMFGKQRASAGASLLLNYEELEKIKNDSINAANSMAEEYSKYMESAEAHITVFKEKLVETYSTFISGDLIKYTADLGSGILDLVNSTDLLKHSILAVLSLNIGKGITTIGASIASAVKQFNMLGSALQQVKNLPVDEKLRKEALQELGEATKILTEKNLKLLLSQKQLEEADRIKIFSAHDLSKEEAKLKLEKMGLLTATKAQTTANVAEAATTGTLKNAMLSLKMAAKEVGVTIKGMFANNPIGMGLM